MGGGLSLGQLVVEVQDVGLQTQLHLFLGLILLLGCLPTRHLHLDDLLMTVWQLDEEKSEQKWRGRERGDGEGKE